jgi:hypothetical protein
MRTSSVAIVCWLVAACGEVKENNPPPIDSSSPEANADTPPQLPMPRLHLKMDDPPDDGALDSAGSHVTSCVSATSCPRVVAGQIGSAYQFGGTRITVAPATDLSPGTGYTLASWVRVEQAPDSTLGNAVIAGKNLSDLDMSYALTVSPGLVPQFYSSSEAGAASNLDGANGVLLGINEWHHLAATWNGSLKVIYIDGQRAGSGGATVMPNNNNLGMTIAQRQSVNMPLTFTGSVDELMMFDRALSDAEVAILAKP